MDNLVLYHANCHDGRGGALAAWLALGDANTRYLPVQYGYPPPWEPGAPTDLTPTDLDGATVYIIDFCYPWGELMAVAERVRRLVIIDHHKTARAQLEAAPPLPNTEVTFDMGRAGCVLAWEHFHAPLPLPMLFAYLQDWDLGHLEFEATRPLHYGLRTLEPDFRAWATLIGPHAQEALDILIRDGRAIQAYLDAEAERVIGPLRRDGQTACAGLAGHRVPLLNLAPDRASDTLRQLLEADPALPFAASYFDLVHDGKRVYQLRSHAAGIDVSEVARAYGGGGHRNAAGFSVPLPPQPVA